MEFGEPHGRKQEYTPLPQIYNVIGLETEKSATKGSECVGPDAMEWANTWEMMNKTVEAIATRNTRDTRVERIRRRQIEKDLQKTKRVYR